MCCSAQRAAKQKSCTEIMTLQEKHDFPRNQAEMKRRLQQSANKHLGLQQRPAKKLTLQRMQRKNQATANSKTSITPAHWFARACAARLGRGDGCSQQSHAYRSASLPRHTPDGSTADVEFVFERDRMKSRGTVRNTLGDTVDDCSQNRK